MARFLFVLSFFLFWLSIKELLAPLCSFCGYDRFLTKPTMNSSSRAPAVAVIVDPIRPAIAMSSTPNRCPPITAPMTPITTFPSRP